MRQFSGDRLYELLGTPFNALLMEELRKGRKDTEEREPWRSHVERKRSRITEWGDEPEQKKVGAAVFQHFYDAGAALCFEPQGTKGELVLDSIFLYTEGAEKLYDRFKGPLPRGLVWEKTNADVVRMFGEPDGRPPRGGTIPMFLDYKWLGLQLDFKEKSYEEANNPLVSLCLYPPSGEPKPPPSAEMIASALKANKPDFSPPTPAVRCGSCLRVHTKDQAPFKFCSACHAIRYCSPECQKADWPTHRFACKKKESAASKSTPSAPSAPTQKPPRTREETD